MEAMGRESGVVLEDHKCTINLLFARKRGFVASDQASTIAASALWDGRMHVRDVTEILVD